MTDGEQWAKALATHRTIWAALLLGATTFLGVAVLCGGWFAARNDGGVLSAIASGCAGLALVAAFVLPPALSKAAALRFTAPAPVPALAGLWTTESIVRWALLEGGALFCGVAYLVEGIPWAAAAAVVLLLALASQIPTATRREAFLGRIGAGAAAPTRGEDQLDSLRPGGE